MLTYDLSKAQGPIYIYIYDCIKADIAKGVLCENDKMPSKRTLASNLGVSIITIENAYEQLISEGYLYAIPKKGYYVSKLYHMRQQNKNKKASLHIKKRDSFPVYAFDFSSNRTSSEDFPFSIWAKLLRDTISQKEKELMTAAPCEGIFELRWAIAEHLKSFRGMTVDPDQIFVGAGTEYLYGLLIHLLGKEKIYGIENPGYKKLKRIYETNGVFCKLIEMDEQGIVVRRLEEAEVQVVHISPTHHFPTGITMPITRRQALLSWAEGKRDRYIIEDDYDSEFRLKGKPVPPLMSIDTAEKVIYMNTFSKSLASTIRISYMVLPRHLANRYFEKLSFYSNTVSTFEQHTLAAFISQGYFEKHINRMRLRYGRKRAKVLEMIADCFTKEECEVIENESGLHFLLKLHTTHSDQEIKGKLMQKDIRIETISDYDMDEKGKKEHHFILNYSSIDMDGLSWALSQLKDVMQEGKKGII